MSLSLQYKNNSQKGSYSKRWSALKLLCLYIMSCNCQNTELLKVLAEVLQAFKLHFAALNYLRNRFSNKKNQRAVHGQLGPAIFPSHLRNIRWILCTKHTPNPPFVCLAPLWITSATLTSRGKHPGKLCTPATSLSPAPGLHQCWHSSCSLPASPALPTKPADRDALPVCLLSAFSKGYLG